MTEVFDACHTLKYGKESERKSPPYVEPSNRDVLRLLGRGSLNTIGNYVKQWKGQDALINATNIKPSDAILHALQAEYTRVTTTLRQEFKPLLDEQTQQIGELQTLLEERDNELVSIESQLAATETARDKAEKQHIADLSAANTSMQTAKSNEAKLNQDFETLQKTYHALDVEKTKIQTELELLKKAKKEQN